MKEICLNWGIGQKHFDDLYKQLLNAYKTGVTRSGKRINLNNPYVKGYVDFFSLTRKISLLRIDITYAETVNYRRIVKNQPDLYACMFSLKEGMDFHSFNTEEKQEMHRLGLSARHSVSYFSSDVQTLYQAVRGERSKVLIVTFASDSLNKLLKNGYEDNLQLFNGNTIKGYTSMNAAMMDKAEELMEGRFEADIHKLYLLGAVYELLANLVDEVQRESGELEKKTGVQEAAQMLHIRNLMFDDFTKGCPLLEDMARHANMSATKFKILFRQVFQMSYYQYYQHYRLLAVKENLLLIQLTNLALIVQAILVWLLKKSSIYYPVKYMK